jgi:hypothetical protein
MEVFMPLTFTPGKKLFLEDIVELVVCPMFCTSEIVSVAQRLS